MKTQKIADRYGFARDRIIEVACDGRYEGLSRAINQDLDELARLNARVVELEAVIRETEEDARGRAFERDLNS